MLSGRPRFENELLQVFATRNAAHARASLPHWSFLWMDSIQIKDLIDSREFERMMKIVRKPLRKLRHHVPLATRIRT